MKTAASCVSVCESQEYQIHRQVERTLRRRHSHVLPSLLHEGRISIHMHRRRRGVSRGGLLLLLRWWSFLRGILVGGDRLGESRLTAPNARLLPEAAAAGSGLAFP